MSRVFSWAAGGFVVGLVVFAVLFFVGFPPNGPASERHLWIVFAVMAAVPVAVIGAIVGAVQVLQEEMRETRREIKAWRAAFELVEEVDRPSTGFKAGAPKGP